MVRSYVRNWYSVAAVYLRIKQYTIANFNNGLSIRVSREDFHEFREALFREFLKGRGFTYSIDENDRPVVTTNTGIRITILPDYSNVIDEIFITKVYSNSCLNGRYVVDIGASVADSSLYFASLGAEKVYAFEVDSIRIDLAQKNVTVNNKSDVIDIIGKPATATEISNLIQTNSLSNIFMKIDCDGCEYKLIDNIPTRVFDQIDDIVLEYTFGVRGLIKKLESVGYKTRHKKHLTVNEGLIYATRYHK